MLHFVKIVVVVSWVFAQILSEMPPFALFFDKKQQNKDDVPHIKTLHFVNIVAVP